MASLGRFIPRLFQFGTNRTVSKYFEGAKVTERLCSTFRRARPTDKVTAYSHEFPELLPELEPEYPGYTVSYEEFKYVENILPKDTVPPPPSNILDGTPTPSGWISSKPESVELPYFVHRTKNHMLPIYLMVKNGQTRIVTKLQKVDGNIWELEADLKTYLIENWQPRIKTQVHEVSSYIIFNGDCCDHVSNPRNKIHKPNQISNGHYGIIFVKRAKIDIVKALTDYHVNWSLENWQAAKIYNDVKAWIASKNQTFFGRGIDFLPSKWEDVIEVGGEYAPE